MRDTRDRCLPQLRSESAGTGSDANGNRGAKEVERLPDAARAAL
jgi:hypothetical protein